MKPACTYSQRALFTAPGAPDDPSTEWAKSICRSCPVIKACAQQALVGGASLDWRVPAVANGVVQAGVYCDGSEEARRQLAAVAGVEVAAEGKQHAAPGDTCAGCGRPMVRWRRGEQPPEGYVMHYARGYCTNCRSLYRKRYPPGGGLELRKRQAMEGIQGENER